MANKQRGNPRDAPNWAPLKREAILVRQLIGSGVTSLGNASYADGLGNYYNAFFGLSIGLERLAKLICVCDHAIDNAGAFPSPKHLKSTYGHDISKLLDAVEEIAERRKLKTSYRRPKGDIQKAIVGCLVSFADAKQGRYNNFDALDSNHSQTKFEPLRNWWDEVAERILQKYYYAQAAEQRVEQNAAAVDGMIGAISSVLHFDERGDVMNSAFNASRHTGKTNIVQKWSRYYALTVVRWLSDVFDKLCHQACYDHGLVSFFGHWEFFSTYRVDDGFLKTRKVWPLH